jgi:hypothetical protein
VLPAVGRGAAVDQLRQAEVEDLDPFVGGDEQVLRFQIAMDNPLAVRRGEASRNGDGITDGLAHRDRAGDQALTQRLPFEQLRDDERGVPLDADVVHRQDVRVVQRGERAGLLLEALEPIGVGRQCRRQHLDRDVASQPRVAGAVDTSPIPPAPSGETIA